MDWSLSQSIGLQTEKTQTSNHFNAHMMSTLFIHSFGQSCTLDIGFYLELFFRLEKIERERKTPKVIIEKGKGKEMRTIREHSNTQCFWFRWYNIVEVIVDSELFPLLLSLSLSFALYLKLEEEKEKKSSFVRLGCMQNGPLPKRCLVLD